MALSDAKFRLSVELNAELMQVEVAVIDRESEKPVKEAKFLAGEVHENVRNSVALYGLSKLLQDRSSDVSFGGKDKSATPEDKIAAMQEVFDLLKLGTWERERKAGAPVVSAEVEALAALKGITVAEAQTALRKYTKEQRDKILSHESIVAKAKEIKAARENASGTSLDDLV